MIAALASLKDNMTDSQKGHTLLKEAKAYADNDNFLSAIEIIGEAINFSPTIVSLYTVRANCYKSLHQYSNAYFDYSYCIRLEPENGSYYCSRGLILCKTKRFLLALEDLDYAIKIEPTPFHYFSRGTIYSDCFMYDNAILDYSRAIADTENISAELNIRALYRRASAYFDKAEYNSTIDDVKTILTLDPAQNQSRALYAKTLKMIGDLREAEFEISQVIESDSSLASYFIERGDIRYRGKKYINDAIDDFNVAVNILEPKVNPDSCPQSSRLSTGRASASIKNNKKQALTPSSPSSKSKFVSDIRSLQSDNSSSTEGFVEYKSEYEKYLADAYYKRAQAKLLLNDGVAILESALSDSQNAFKLTPWDDDFKLLVGICYIKLEDYEKALGVLHDTISKIINPPLISFSKNGKITSNLTPVGTMIKALYHSAYCNRHLGNNKAAIEDLTRIIIIADKMKPEEVIVSNDDNPVFDSIQESVYHNNMLQESDEVKAVDEEGVQEGNNEVETSVEPAVDTAIELLPSSNIEEKEDAINVTESEEIAPIITVESEQVNDSIVVNLAAVDMNPVVAPVNNAGASVINGSHDVPLFKVYEMRGILFYEAHTYEFALKDFSKCIILDADNADVIYLRGECHFQLGNYELALEDFYVTEEKDNFTHDISTLYTSRGIVLRLLGHSVDARKDFELAYDRLTNAANNDEISVKGRIRILNLHAMAYIDSREYHEARFLLEQALEVLEGLLTDRISNLPPPIIKPNPNPYAKVEPKQIVPRDLVQLIKSKWVTRYHIALTMYMLHQYNEAEELLVILIHNIQSNTKASLNIDALPDDFARGQCIFYLGMTSFKLGKYEEAINIYEEAIQSAWGRVVKNKMIALFAKGKAYQCIIRHPEAIETFSACLGLDSKSSICSFVYFRRAWSYKKLGQLDESCADFEYAKRLNPNNPNFCVDYKAIVGFEFIQVNSDPDLTSIFPPLWDRITF